MQNEVARFDPDYIVVSLGVDTFEGDPVGGMKVSTAGFRRIGKCLNIGRKTLFVMEGGYAVDDLGTNVANVLLGFESA